MAFIYVEQTYNTIEPFANTTIEVVQNDPINKNQQYNLAEYIYLDNEISLYSSNTILQLQNEPINDFNPAIYLQSDFIYWVSNEQILNYSDVQISDGIDDSIRSTTTISDITLGAVFNVDSLTATTAVSTDAELVLQIGGATLISIISTESVSTDNDILNRRFLDPNSIESAESLENNNEVLNRLELQSINSTTTFENDLEALLEIGGATLISIESGLDVGALQINRAFTVDTFFTQTQQFGEDVLILYIGTEGTNLVSVDSTTTFGTPVFSDFIHRSLIFKNDNITKVGVSDAVEIAGGIVMNSSGKITTSATGGDYSVPSTAAGFILVTIDGVNYKMPYYNE